MKKFEYKRVLLPELYELNELGEQGWELVYVRDDDMYFYFKREIIGKTDNNIC